MPTKNSAATSEPTNGDAYAALCIWEEMLAIKARNAPEHRDLLRHWERVGTYAMRTEALSLGGFANAVWRALDDELREALEPFDWEFVSALVTTIGFDTHEFGLPPVESAVADLSILAATRAGAASSPAKASPSHWGEPGSRLFLVAYEADGRPYALALSDLEVAHKIAGLRGGEVIDTAVDRHADMAAPSSRTYTVEVTWRVPEYVHLTVEASSPDHASTKALAEVAEHPDRFERKLDFETCGPDEVTGIREGDEPYPDGRPRSLPLAAIRGRDDGHSVLVARYQNRHGDVETRVFRKKALALAWRDEIARENWNSARDGAPPDAIGDAYFEVQSDRGEESFSVEQCSLHG
jgi:hypothetical protein